MVIFNHGNDPGKEIQDKIRNKIDSDQKNDRETLNYLEPHPLLGLSNKLESKCFSLS